VKRAGVLLSGCGAMDGSEIVEASSVLINLTRRNVEVQCFSLDKPQFDVMDMHKGEPIQQQYLSI
jgi:enhancing lycopene biosynthesis protein 2